MTKDDTEPYVFDTRGVAEYLRVSPSHLEKLRLYDPENSPPFVRIGRSVRYPVRAVIEWAEARMNGTPWAASGLMPTQTRRPGK